MAHTPGPWHTAKRAGGLAIEHREEKSYGWLQHEVALVYPLAEADRGTGAANAALIAAAPDLLEALQCLMSQTIEMDEKYGVALSEGEHEAALLARAAIAKAKGN